MLILKNPSTDDLKKIVLVGKREQIKALFNNGDLHVWHSLIEHEKACDFLGFNFTFTLPFIFSINSLYKVIGVYFASNFMETETGRNLRIIGKDFQKVREKIEANENFKRIADSGKIEWQGI